MNGRAAMMAGDSVLPRRHSVHYFQDGDIKEL